MINLIIIKYFISISLLLLSFSILINKRIVLTFHELKIVLFFVAIFLHSFLFSSNVDLSAERSIYSLLVIIMLFMLRNAFDLSLFRFIKNVALMSSLILVVICDYVILQYGSSSSYFIEGNFIGLSSNSNYFGLLLSVFLIPLSLSHFVERKWNTDLYTIIILLILINLFYILIETRSRTSMLAALTACAVGMYMKYKNVFSKKYIFLLIFVFLTGLIVPLKDTMFNKYGGGFESTFSTRMVLWEHRIEGIEEKPFLGWGFQINSASSKFHGSHVFNELEKGNTPLALLEEFGVFFGSLLIVFLSSFIYKFLKLKSEYILVPMVVIPALVHSMFETWLFNFNGYYTWILWYLVFIGCSGIHKNEMTNQVIYKHVDIEQV